MCDFSLAVCVVLSHVFFFQLRAAELQLWTSTLVSEVLTFLTADLVFNLGSIYFNSTNSQFPRYLLNATTTHL
jgi:hypothetical protein